MGSTQRARSAIRPSGAPWRIASLVALVFVVGACTGIAGQPRGPDGEDGPGKDEDGVAAGPDDEPGRVTLHRLNRVEYDNTVRDLLGTSERPSAAFPPDDRGYGYDNIADVLSLSPLQLELYYRAAEQLIASALAGGATRRVLEAEQGTATVGFAQEGGWVLDSAGQVAQRVPIEQAGSYRIAVRAYQQRAGDEPARMRVSLDDVELDTLDVPDEAGAPLRFETTVSLEPGTVRLAAAFTNDFYDGAAGLDRNLVVDAFEVEGPLGASEGAARARVLVCEPDPANPLPCVSRIVRGFGRRAFRRPLADEEVAALTGLFETARAAGDTLDQALAVMLSAVLTSPHFLFRVELDPEPGKARWLNDFELASRLSYFLWSSMPDDALLDAAERGELARDAGLRAQVKRMLADDRAEALVTNFAGQWLFARAVADLHPDAHAFPGFDDALRSSARRETDAYFRAFLQGGESMARFLTADFGFFDERLAAHYGATAGAEPFARTGLPDSRVGLLTQTTFLAVTSYPTRTSPVKRGKWLLEQLLCSPPPAPPANIPPLEASQGEALTVREQLEEHRRNPACAACHKVMDPLGFGLEGYDAIGAFRTTENGVAVDDRGELPDGAQFRGARELAELVQSDARFPRCVTRHLFTYALGRGLAPHDNADIDQLTKHFVAGGMHLPALIEEMVLSAPFRVRGAEEDEQP